MSTPTVPFEISGRSGGMMQTVTYRLIDKATGQWVWIDPTYDVGETFDDVFAGRKGDPAGIWITHGHIDHVAGVAETLRRWPGIPVLIHPISQPMLESSTLNGAALFGLPYEPAKATGTFEDGGTATIGESTFKVIRADGHCPGSVMFYAEGHLIGGDVLFRGGTGRWDLPGGDYHVLAQSMREKVMTLPDDTIVYPGHGPTTTVGTERKSNFIVRKMLDGETVE